MKIYLDNCCFNRPFDDQSQIKIHIEAQAKLDIQKNIKQGNYVTGIKIINPTQFILEEV